MRFIQGFTLLVLAVLLGGSARPGAAQTPVPVYNPANGHWYQIITPASTVSWQQARDAAAALSDAGYPGHLATVTSLAENQFIWDNVIQHNPAHSDFLLGGYQDHSAPDYSEPAGGWRWVTGEPWSFTLWAPGEPNNTDGIEDVLGYYGPELDHWNDFSPAPRVVPFIVEFEPPLSPGGAANAAGLTLFPNPALGGQPALGQVTLAQPAGAGGEVLSLTSSNPAAAVVPATVTVPAGASSVTFVITTLPVAAPTPVTIAAACAFGPATAVLQVLPFGSVPAVPPPSEARLLVSSHDSGSVLQFDGQTGAFIDTFVTPGSGGLECAHDLALGPDGNLYVSNRCHHSILRYNGQTGAFIDTFVPLGSGGLDTPIGLVFGPDDNLYVSSYGTDSILRYDGRTGTFLGALVGPNSGGLRQPYGLVFGPDGSLYVCSEGASSVLRYDGHTGAFLGAFVPSGSGGLSAAHGLAFGPDGDLYVSGWRSNNVLRYDGRTGTFISVFVPAGSGGLALPFGVAFGPDGNLYVANFGTNSVLRYEGRTGAFLGPFCAGHGLDGADWLLFVPAPAGG